MPPPPAPLDSLNDRQREAVYHDGGALVLAGAGTGKTRVLTGRIIRLLADNAARPRDILAVTFTNKAAREMRERIESALPLPPRGLLVGTFHGVCHRVLRYHAAAAGLARDFQILDAQDQLVFLRRLMRDNKISEKEFAPAEVRGYIAAAKERGLRAAAAPAEGPRRRAMADIYALYESACRREHKLDFAELMLAVLELWRADDDLRRHYAARFRHILVDELQDTNAQQFDWLAMLDNGDNHFFAVGDDDQSIYAFRGAEPDIMRRFQSRLRAARLIRLEKNYRSGKNILNAANRLITGNSNRLGKTLTTDAAAGAPVAMRPSENDMAEADDVAREVAGALAAGDAAAGDFAVLYRTNAQARQFERAFMENGVPYRVYGGLRFYERAEVKHVLAYLRLAAGDDRDALTRVINMPPRGIGAKTVETLYAGGDPFAALAAADAAKLRAFRALLQELREAAAGGSLRDLTRAAAEKSGLLAYYEERRENERGENIRELVNAVRQFEENFAAAADDGESALQAFLAAAALDSGDEGESGGQSVSLMTVHAAKGLEFNRVFIAGLEEGLFPHALSLESAADGGDIEEERRLLYVAITRARRHLSLHFARRRMQYGNTVNLPPSRFLRELNLDDTAAAAADAPAEIARAAKAKAAPASPGETLRPGDSVHHPKYGSGVVLRRQGGGAEAMADVMFKRFGIKQFKIALAPLRKNAR